MDVVHVKYDKPAEFPKGEDYGIDGLYAAVDILETTIGKVDGYKSDDGILEHKCAISAVKELSKQHKPWSEEDEKIINKLIAVVELYYGIGNDLDKQRCLSWLNSLKDRYTWKPTKEQLTELRCVISGCSYDIEPLVELEKELKAL